MKLSSGILGLTLSSVVALASANAADLSAPFGGGYKDFGPAPLWAGFYGGVNGGYAWGTEVDINSTVTTNADVSPNSGGAAASATGDGAFGGGQIGYNIQRDRLVFGLEADFEGADVTGSATLSGGPFSGWSGTATAESDLDWFGTVRGRLGLTFPGWGGLLYATGGFAYGEIEHKLTGSISHNGAVIGSASASNDEVETGWVLGAGYEHFITPSLSLKVEYQYIDLGQENLTIGSGPQKIGNVTAQVTTNATFFDSFSTVRAGVNYHLGAVYEPLK